MKGILNIVLKAMASAAFFIVSFSVGYFYFVFLPGAHDGQFLLAMAQEPSPPVRLEGNVIAVNDEEKFIVIDRGKTSGITTGILIAISRAGSKFATARIIEVRQDIAAADILDVSPGWKIQEGDTITVS